MRAMWLVLAITSCGACAGSARERNESLTDDVRSFQDGMRWRRYEEAAEFISPERRDQFLDARDEIDHDLRIDDFEIERVKIGKTPEDAIIQVRFTWHLDSMGVVHETVVDEHWEKHGKSWRIVSADHKHGEEMPVILEPESQPASAPTSAPATAPAAH